MEAKFSLRATVALALSGADTAEPDTFTDQRLTAPLYRMLLDRIDVRFDPRLTDYQARVSVVAAQGQADSAFSDVGLAPAPAAEGRWLRSKYHRLAGPVIGADRANALEHLVDEVQRLGSVSTADVLRGAQLSALAGLRVLELGEGIAGAFAARLLGDLGADVVKLRESAFTASPDDPLFQYLHWNKRFVEPGVAPERERLITTADVVICSGIGQGEPLRELNQRAVLTLISPFGQTGPYRDYAATDLVLQAMSGLMAISGCSGREPLRHGLRTSYYLAGLNAAYATLAGVLAARRTGAGVTIDLAIRDCLSSELVMNHALHVFTGVVQGPPPAANDPFDGHPTATGDGFVSLQTSARQGPVEIAELLNEPALAELRFATADARAESGSELREILDDRLSGERALTVFLQASQRGLLSGAVQHADDLLSCPQLEHRGLFTTVPHRSANGGALRLPLTLAQMSRTPSTMRAPAPTQVAGALTWIAPRGVDECGASTQPAGESSLAGDRSPVTKPLAGIRVLDLSVIFAAPYMAACCLTSAPR